MTKKQEQVVDPVIDPVEPEVETAQTEPADAAQELPEVVEGVGAPTGPTFAASISNIAYDKVASNKLGALCTGMGYAPDVDVATTKATQYIGGAAETIGYSAPAPQKQ